MQSESAIDLNSLIAAIPGDNPAGEPVSFQVREDLEQFRKEIDPDDFDPNDPARPTEAKKADWPKIRQLGISTLCGSSKDLLVAARTVEALAREQGFAGLADGFALLRALVEECWDRMYPEIEDGDVEVRSGPFNWLGEADRGSRFPTTVRGLPLINGASKPLAWRDWRAVQDGRGNRAELEQGVAAVSRDDCQKTFDDLTRCLTEFNGLTDALNRKMGPVSPALTDLRSAVADCYTLAKLFLDQKGPAPEEATGEPEGGDPAGPQPTGEAAAAARPAATRADAYRRLAEAADLLERLEPHSPIPYLVRRAVGLGALPYPQLMKALIRDSSVLSELYREFGIKESEES